MPGNSQPATDSYSRKTSSNSTSAPKISGFFWVFNPNDQQKLDLLLPLLPKLYLAFSSLAYRDGDCNVKTGVAGMVELVQDEQVDVILGPLCSTGTSRFFTFMNHDLYKSWILEFAVKQPRRPKFSILFSTHVSAFFLRPVKPKQLLVPSLSGIASEMAVLACARSKKRLLAFGSTVGSLRNSNSLRVLSEAKAVFVHAQTPCVCRLNSGLTGCVVSFINFGRVFTAKFAITSETKNSDHAKETLIWRKAASR